MRKSQDGKLLFITSGVAELSVFETDDGNLPREENELKSEMIAFDTTDTNDSYLVAVTTKSEDNLADVWLYSIKKDLKSKQLELIRRFNSNMKENYNYRTVKIFPNQHIAMIAINNDDDEPLTMKFILMDAKATPGTVISFRSNISGRRKM